MPLSFKYKLKKNFIIPLIFLFTQSLIPQSTNPPEQTLIGIWKFDEGMGNTVYDGSLYSNNGNVNGAKWSTGKLNHALSFVDSGDAIIIPNSQSISNISSQITIMFWMYSYERDAEWTTVIQRSNADLSWMDWQVYVKAVDAQVPDRPVFRVDWNSNGINEEDDEVMGDITLENNKWYHIACTYDGEYMRFYIDGTQRNETRKLNGTIPNSGRNIWVGTNETWPFEYYYGLIDELQLFSRALSGQEIQNYYNNTVTDVEDNFSSNKFSYQLQQNYPNPFNPVTKISYVVPTAEFVSLKVYDLFGKEVAILVDEVKSSGQHSVDFDASALSSGVYFYTIQAGSFKDSKKLILMK